MIDMEKIFKGPLPEDLRLVAIEDDVEEDVKETILKKNKEIEKKLAEMSEEDKDKLRPWILEAKAAMVPMEFTDRNGLWARYVTPKVQVKGQSFTMKDMDVNIFGLQADSMTVVTEKVTLNGKDQDNREFVGTEESPEGQVFLIGDDPKDFNGIPLCVTDWISGVVMTKYFRSEEEQDVVPAGN